MTGPAARRPGRALGLLGAALLVLAAALGAGLLTAPAAQAHDRLESSAPADGAVVQAAPTSVVLTFDAPAIALGSKVVVTGPDGTVVSAGEAQFVDTTVTQPLSGDLGAGQYRVEWRVTSSDGHPVSGTFAYTASAPSAAATSASPSAGDPASTPATTPAASSSDVPTEAASSPATEPVAVASSSGTPGWAVALGAVAALAVVAAVAAAVLRLRRR